MATRRTAGGGRRPGDSNTREAILTAALDSFAEVGYGPTSIRGIARQAGVDPSLVVHFFGNKEGLFAASLDQQNSPFHRIVEALKGEPDGIGERLARSYLDCWEDPAMRGRMRAVLHAVTSSPTAGGILKGFISEQVLQPVTAQLTTDRPELRANLAGSHLAGIALARYVLKVEPIASLPSGELARLIAPTLQRYMTGELPA